jgi:hypothetical protein
MENVMDSEMSRPLMRFAFIVSLSITAVMMTAASASAQIPTSAQRQALRANCVSDYRANCATVPTGGMAALVCLEEHVDKLSTACKSAVLAAEGHPAAAAATPAPAPSPSASSQSKPSQPATSSPSTTAAQAAPAAPVRAPLPFFQEIRIAARACARDFRLLCPGVPMGHGNIIFCLRVHANRLDTACRNALMAAGEQL